MTTSSLDFAEFVSLVMLKLGAKIRYKHGEQVKLQTFKNSLRKVTNTITA